VMVCPPSQKAQAVEKETVVEAQAALEGQATATVAKDLALVFITKLVKKVAQPKETMTTTLRTIDSKIETPLWRMLWPQQWLSLSRSLYA